MFCRVLAGSFLFDVFLAMTFWTSENDIKKSTFLGETPLNNQYTLEKKDRKAKHLLSGGGYKCVGW
jgi:hypothetical protein